MKTNRNAWDDVNLIAQIADLKQSTYGNALAISALIEILVEKGILSPEDFHRKAAKLERHDTETVRETPPADAPASASEPTRADARRSSGGTAFDAPVVPPYYPDAPSGNPYDPHHL